MGQFDFAWFAATYLSYSTLLAMFVFLKLSRIYIGNQVINNQSKPKNYLTVTLFVLIAVDLLVGCALVSLLALNHRVYDSGEPILF